jgi:hypothetical protein
MDKRNKELLIELYNTAIMLFKTFMIAGVCIFWIIVIGGYLFPTTDSNFRIGVETGMVCLAIMGLLGFLIFDDRLDNLTEVEE